jgi:uroporphyrinogen decarboxylase
MHFKKVDRVPDEEFGYWDECLTRWHNEGLPKEVNNNEVADVYFEFDRRKWVPVNIGLMPPFEYRVLEEDATHKVIINSEGVKCIVNKDAIQTIPKYLEFPIKDKADWERFKKRLNPHTPAKYPDNWEELKKEWLNRDYPLGISVGSLFGWLRNWMGFENVTVAFYDEPKLIEDMMEYLTNYILTIIDKAVREVKLDFASVWEDMAFNKGPIISPKLFKEYMVPRYKRITDFLKKYGVDVVIVDCDGNINELVELWIEGGVNCMFPIEVAGGSDPIQIRDKYGDKVLLAGGVDKVALIKGKEEIKKEINRLKKLVEMGGYIPHVDHRVPSDVSFDNYLYYLEVKRDTFGIEKPSAKADGFVSGIRRRDSIRPEENLGVRT